MINNYVCNVARSALSKIVIRAPQSRTIPFIPGRRDMINKCRILVVNEFAGDIGTTTNSLGNTIKYFHFQNNKDPDYNITTNYTMLISPPLDKNLTEDGTPDHYRWYASKSNCNSLLYMYDGWMLSDQGSSPSNENRIKDDAICVYNSCINDLNLNSDEIILVGHNSGCFATLSLAKHIAYQSKNCNVKRKIGGIVLHSPTKSKITQMIDGYCVKSTNKYKDLFIGKDYENSDFYQKWIKKCDILDCKWLIKSNPKVFSDSTVPVFILGGQLDREHPFSHQLELFKLIKDMRKKKNSCQDKHDNVDCLWFSETGDDYWFATDANDELVFPMYMSQYISNLKKKQAT